MMEFDTIVTLDEFRSRGWSVNVSPMGVLWGVSASHEDLGVVMVLARETWQEAVQDMCASMEEEEEKGSA